MRDIKNLGDFEAVVHYHKEVEVKIPVKVVAENAAPAEEVVEAPVAEPAEAPEFDEEEALDAE